MLYLLRLFVYHADAPKGSALSKTFKVMERRLLKGIVNPSMILVFLTGSRWDAVQLELGALLLIREQGDATFDSATARGPHP